MEIKDKSNAEYYSWGDRCDSWVLVDSEELSIKQESMPAKAKEKRHFHSKAQQFFFILKGTATFDIESEKYTVIAQQGLQIKPNTKHFIANDSDSQLDFLVISQPSTNKDRILCKPGNSQG